MRQHFVPVFYLKNFTNPDGFFYIYEVTKRAFKRNGKKFAPSTHFYEHDLNTVFNGNDSSNFIESSFGKYDTNISAIIDKVKNEDAKTLTPQEWTFLQYFVNILYWRNPLNTKHIEKLVAEAKNLSTFGMSLRNKTTGIRSSDDDERKIINNPAFIKFLRLKMPGTTYPEIFKGGKDFAQIITFPDILPKMVSDNPIIYLNRQNQSLHTAPFIFPLTHTKVLFRHTKDRLSVNGIIRVAIDMLLLVQATNYIACTNKGYPDMLLQNFEKNFKSIDELKEFISTRI